MGSNVYITQVDVRHKKDPALDNQMPSNIAPTNSASTNVTQPNTDQPNTDQLNTAPTGQP
jgi:hypothetical protein